tara:strand:- start:221 stop:406 length:186 start_codon:yes stop_codon:yes gene_type:complete
MFTDRIQIIDRRRVADGYIVLVKFNSEWATGWQPKPGAPWVRGSYKRDPVEALRDFQRRER